jgi:hypothetical protein
LRFRHHSRPAHAAGAQIVHACQRGIGDGELDDVASGLDLEGDQARLERGVVEARRIVEAEHEAARRVDLDHPAGRVGDA